MVALAMYHICLIFTAIGSLVRGGLPCQGADEAYVRLLAEATYVFQNRFFDLLMNHQRVKVRYLSTGHGFFEQIF